MQIGTKEGTLLLNELFSGSLLETCAAFSVLPHPVKGGCQCYLKTPFRPTPSSCYNTSEYSPPLVIFQVHKRVQSSAERKKRHDVLPFAVPSFPIHVNG